MHLKVWQSDISFQKQAPYAYGSGKFFLADAS